MWLGRFVFRFRRADRALATGIAIGAVFAIPWVPLSSVEPTASGLQRIALLDVRQYVVERVHVETD